jgi:hypothetical protein
MQAFHLTSIPHIFLPNLRELGQLLHPFVPDATQPQAQRTQRQARQGSQAAVGDAATAVQVETGERGVALEAG